MMHAFDLVWMEEEWTHIEDRQYVLNDDAPLEAKESYSRYLRQLLDIERRIKYKQANTYIYSVKYTKDINIDRSLFQKLMHKRLTYKIDVLLNKTDAEMYKILDEWFAEIVTKVVEIQLNISK